MIARVRKQRNEAGPRSQNVLQDTNSAKREIWESLDEKNSRDAFVAAHLSNTIGAQIFSMRESRGWSQGDLAEKVDMAQPRISVLEGGYDSYSLKTLRRLASAFDVAVVVRFVPFSELVDWVADTSGEQLAPVAFDNDNLEANDNLQAPQTDGYVIAASDELWAAPYEEGAASYLASETPTFRSSTGVLSAAYIDAWQTAPCYISGSERLTANAVNIAAFLQRQTSLPTFALSNQGSVFLEKTVDFGNINQPILLNAASLPANALIYNCQNMFVDLSLYEYFDKPINAGATHEADQLVAGILSSRGVAGRSGTGGWGTDSERHFDIARNVQVYGRALSSQAGHGTGYAISTPGLSVSKW